MTHEETIFAEALSRESAAARAAYLDEACGGNEKLRADVEGLLLAHDRPRGVLESPPEGCDVTLEMHSSSQGVGSTIGPYKLLEQIGSGGMGVVYMAEQTRPVRRKVALKIIKPGMDSGQVIARFEAERQALTMMDHPNIARVLDAGATEGGRPYFVMELVKGVPITDYCDQARLTTRQRLDLFVQVCQAVQHAHQKGVIHRDLKPTNILVTLHDDKPVPKVIDFGIAKATGQVLTDRTLFTNYAQMLGTPLYMSPEQAQISGLDVDTRSDVYSLGVLLYELLTGTTPFDKQRLGEAAYDEMRRIIREEDPPKPSTRLSTMGDQLASVSAQRHTEAKKLGQLVRGELDWIVMKALEKDRARRYETAVGLGRDVERYLGDEAVQACPPSARYRFRKFARRNKTAMLTASAAVVTLLLLVAGLSVNNRIIATERNEKARALEDKERALALATSESLRSRKNFMRASVAIREVLMKPALALDEWNQMPPALREKYAAEAMKYYQGLVQHGDADPSLGYETAIGYRSIALLHRRSGDNQRGEECYRHALAILDRLVAAEPANAQYRHQLAYTQYRFAAALAGDKRVPEAEEWFGKAAGAYLNLLKDVGAQSPGDYHREFASCMVAWQRVSNRTPYWEMPKGQDELIAGGSRAQQPADGSRPDAEQVYREAAEGFAALAAEYPTVQAYEVVQADAALQLGQRLAQRGQADEAEKAYRDAVSRYERLARQSPDNPRDQAELGRTSNRWHRLELARSRRHLGDLLRRENRVAEAESEFRSAIELFGALAAETPTDPNHRQWVAEVLWSLGDARLQTGRFAEAEQDYREALKRYEQLSADYPANPFYRQEQGFSHRKLAHLMERAGRSADAEAHLRDALGWYMKLVAEIPDSAFYREEAAFVNWTLASLLQRDRRWPESEAALREAIRLNPALPGPREMLAEAGAEAKAREAVRLQPGSAGAHRTLGEVLRRRGDLTGSEAAFLEAIRLNPDDVELRSAIGPTYARLGRWDDAAAAFRQAVELTPADLPTLFRTAALSFHTGDLETYRRACHALVQHFGGTDNIQVADCTIKACSLAPGFGADPQKVTRLAAAEMFRTQTGPAREWFDLARALVELRAGRSDSAAEIITRSAPSHDTHRDASAFAILAMARHRPGNGDDARAALSTAQRIIAAKMPKPEKGETFGDDWHDWLHARILCREAEEMLAEPAPRP